MKWRVWITGYPDSASIVEAIECADAMRKGAREQKASHHGEIVEINAHPVHLNITQSRFARISRDGAITFEV